MKEIQDNQEIPIPEGLEQRLSTLVDRLEAEERKRRAKRIVRFTRYVFAAAACILLLLVFRFTQEPVEEKPVLPLGQPQAEVTEPVEQSTLQPTPESTPEEKPRVAHEPNKAHKPHKPQEKPLLAEAEPITEAPARNNHEERFSDPSNPYLLATAQLQDLRSRGERLDREVAMLMQH